MKEGFFLLISIVSEVIGTSTLKLTDGFKNLKPTLIVIIAYLIAFFFLNLAIKTIPVGVAYAIWAGVGIVLITLIGYFFYHENLSLYQITGIILITVGVILVNLFSKGH